jgi:hypothetical protein
LEPFNPTFPASPVAFEVASFTTVAGAAPASIRLPVSPSKEGTVRIDIALHRHKDNRESGIVRLHMRSRKALSIVRQIDLCCLFTLTDRVFAKEGIPMQHEANVSETPLMPFVLQYAAAFAFLSILAILFFALTNIESPSAMGLIAAMASLAIPANSFVKKTRRAMTTRERALFATLATLAIVIVSIALTVGMLALSGLPVSFEGLGQLAGIGSGEIETDILGYIMLGVLVLYWVVIFFGMAWMCRSSLKQFERLGK